jgi:hypothetical protein
MDQTFDRLEGFSLDQDYSSKDHMKNDFGDTFTTKNGDLNSFLMAGKKAPREADTYSEIFDEDKKQAIFNHSIKGGLFKNINNSPLRDKMPASLKIYQDGKPQVDTYLQENHPFNATSTAQFAKFESAAPVKGPDAGNSFKFNPKKFFCPSHPSVEVEFCNGISGNFYCLKCLPKYKGQKDVVLSEIIKDV